MVEIIRLIERASKDFRFRIGARLSWKQADHQYDVHMGNFKEGDRDAIMLRRGALSN